MNEIINLDKFHKAFGKGLAYYVYFLRDPNSNDIRYIGCTAKPKGRLTGHLSTARGKNETHKDKWIAGLLGRGERPIMELDFRASDRSLAQYLESFMIVYYRTTENNLLNKHASFTEEEREIVLGIIKGSVDRLDLYRKAVDAYYRHFIAPVLKRESIEWFKWREEGGEILRLDSYL